MCAGRLRLRVGGGGGREGEGRGDDSGEGGAATTLFYGPLGKALAIAAQQEEDVQAGLYLATENDVVAYLDLEE